MAVAFEDRFAAWLTASLQQQPPATVRAFALNLYESAGKRGVRFAVELVGADRFDPNDPDWPCYETWRPTTRGIDIPITFSGDRWELCLVKVRGFVEERLQNDPLIQERLDAVEGVGIGFVDGDLFLIRVR